MYYFGSINIMKCFSHILILFLDLISINFNISVNQSRIVTVTDLVSL